MTNEEFYKDDLLREIMIDTLGIKKETRKPAACSYMTCEECLFEPHDCGEKMAKWLKQEHVEQVVDWSKVKVDTPILVKHCKDSVWIRRYFSKFEDGKVYAWTNGATSWTARGEHDVTSWNYAKLTEN